jgi:RimJ/RimL family protein N-acetyltransferase
VFPIETGRVVLRPFERQDVDAIYALVYADRRVRESWSGYTGSLQAVRARFPIDPVWHAEDGFGFHADVRKADDRLLGLMGFQRFTPGEDTRHLCFEDPADAVGRDPTKSEVELTYALGRAYWGYGYATEAGQALIEIGFRRLDTDRIVNAVLVHPEHRSLALIERLGFRVVKNLKPPALNQGTFAGASGAIGILTRAAWEASQADERNLVCRS